MPTKKKSYSLASLNDEKEIREVADKLSAFIESNDLNANIRGKSYATVESWLYAGSLLNLRAIPGIPENLSTEKEIKYSCTVEIFDVSGATPVLVSRGSSVASSLEGFFRKAPEFAINSMSQTRAIGKAYRMLIGHLLKVAGYEATPSEEMSHLDETKTPKSTGIERENLLDLIKFTLRKCTSTDDIVRLGKDLGPLGKDKEIRALMNPVYQELQAEEKENSIPVAIEKEDLLDMDPEQALKVLEELQDEIGEDEHNKKLSNN